MALEPLGRFFLARFLFDVEVEGAFRVVLVVIWKKSAR